MLVPEYEEHSISIQEMKTPIRVEADTSQQHVSNFNQGSSANRSETKEKSNKEAKKTVKKVKKKASPQIKKEKTVNTKL